MKNNCFGTLYLYELKKIFKSKAAIITFFILLIMAVVFGENEVSSNADAKLQIELQKIDGRKIDDTLLDELEKENNYSVETYKGVTRWVEDILGDDKIPDDLTVEKLGQIRKDGIKEAKELLYLTQGEYDYWDKKEVDLPDIWQDTLKSEGYVYGAKDMFLLAVLFLIPMGLAGVFAAEYQKNTDSLIKVSRNGNKRTYYAKVLAGMTFGVAGTMIIIGSMVGYMVIRFGTMSLNTQILLIYPFASVYMTVKELLFRMCGLILTGCAMLSAMILFLSQALKNALSVMGVSFGMWFLNAIVDSAVPGKYRFLSQFFHMLPYSAVDGNMVYEYRLVCVFGIYFTIYEFAPFMYILFAIIFVVAGRIIYGKQR